MPLFSKRTPSKDEGRASFTGNFPQPSEQVVQQAQHAMAVTQDAAANAQAGYTQLKDEAQAGYDAANAAKSELEGIVKGDAPVAEKVLAVLKVFQPCMSAIWRGLCCLLPLYMKLFEWLYFLYYWAPKKVVTMAIGVVLCFFGGTYMASLAAIEAFIRMGGERLWGDVVFVAMEVKKVVDANKEDEEKGGEGTLSHELKDGLPTDLDAKEALSDATAIANRKIFLAFSTVSEPKRLETAVANLWSAYTAVLATLSLQFAKIVALALGMAKVVLPLLTKLLTPLLEYLLDPKLHHWIETSINSTVNFLAMFIAWKIAEVIAAVYSGLRGGQMFALALFGFIADWGLIEKLPECMVTYVKPWFDPATSFLDEIIGYTLAFIGIWWQVIDGGDIFFPLDLVLMPLSLVEWFLRYQITFTAAGGGAGAAGAGA